MRSVVGLLALGACMVVGATPVAAQSGRPVIASERDLPPTRYPMPTLPSELLLSPQLMTDLLPPVAAEAERLLRDYDITDPVLSSEIRRGLMAAAWLRNRPDELLRLAAEQSAAETKPQLQQIGTVIDEAVAAGLQASPEQRCAVVEARLRQRLSEADPLSIRDAVLSRYGGVQVISPGFHVGSAALGIDGEAKEQGSLGLFGALGLLTLRYQIESIPPCRAEMTRALRTWLDDPAHRPVDVWPAREPSEADLADAQPVVAAVWEAGYDPTLFSGRLAFDPAEPIDGRDNDGNGVIDDWNGPTYDMYLRPGPAAMHPPSPELAARLGLQTALEKGLLDLRYGDDTPEARFAAERSRDADLAEQIADVRTSAEWSGWVHGTWVASLISDTAPFVRLYTITNFMVDDHPDPVRVNEADMQRWADTLPAVGARLRGAGVRIVNMSWGGDADGIARDLLRSGEETDPVRAAERAAVMHQLFRDAVSALIRDCPDVLFVAAAGNSDRTAEQAQSTPQTLDHPNLLVVGGANASGGVTAFSTYGDEVRLYALAEGNQVRVPGGQIMRASGTSFAAPTAVRAAASMLAVNPDLTLVQVIEGLIATAHGEAAVDLPLLDIGAAVRWARARR